MDVIRVQFPSVLKKFFKKMIFLKRRKNEHVEIGKQVPLKKEWRKSLRVQVSLFVSCFNSSVKP